MSSQGRLTSKTDVNYFYPAGVVLSSMIDLSDRWVMTSKFLSIPHTRSPTSGLATFLALLISMPVKAGGVLIRDLNHHEATGFGGG